MGGGNVLGPEGDKRFQRRKGSGMKWIRNWALTACRCGLRGNCPRDVGG